MSLYLSDGFIITRNVTGCCFMKSLLGKGGKTDFQVRPWGIRRTRKSVVPLNQQAVTRRVTIGYPTQSASFEERTATIIHSQPFEFSDDGTKTGRATEPVLLFFFE